MRAYLVRHGDAVPEHPSGDRPLSDLGRKEAQRMAEFLTAQGVGVASIVHSGKARAAQTAQLLNEGLFGDAELEVWSGLHPNDPVAPVGKRLRRLESDLMIVGHLPFMAKLAGHLVCGEEDAILELHTTAVACLLRGEDDAWLLEWLTYPALVGAD